MAENFTHLIPGYFIGTGAIIWSKQNDNRDVFVFYRAGNNGKVYTVIIFFISGRTLTKWNIGYFIIIIFWYFGQHRVWYGQQQTKQNNTWGSFCDMLYLQNLLLKKNKLKSASGNFHFIA